MKLGKGIIQVVFSNILNLIISIGNGFLLPKYLSIESYASLKVFLLYISYIGVLHFGYIDGIYIKYGGKTVNEINLEEFVREKKILALFQMGLSLLLILVALFFSDFNLFFAAACLLPVNMLSFYKLVYQAMGNFKEYRFVTNLSSVLIFIGNLFLLFGVGIDDSSWYVGIQVVLSFVVWIYYEKKNKVTGIENRISAREMRNCIKKNIHLGIIIMLGNFMGIWITSIDRWFVKFFCGISEFAYYSFAVTMLKLINVVITAFSITLYNFFCKISGEEEICRLRRIVLIVGAVMIAVVFPLNFVLEVYLAKYIKALSVIRLLFAAQFVMIGVNAIYLNLYKALNLQKKYLIRMIIVTMVALILNASVISLDSNNITSYAFATLLTSIIWLVLCQIDLPQYRMKYDEWMYILLTLIGYFWCGQLNIWVGMAIYVLWILTGIFLLFYKDIKLFLKNKG